ncbi:hypothetical protein ACLB2K_072365 [Fragaria x ananassa]
MTSSDHVVLPEFYNIDPSDVRKQNGGVAIALTRHGKMSSPEKLQGWRTALNEVADLAAMVLQNQSEGYVTSVPFYQPFIVPCTTKRLIKQIVDEIEAKLCRIPNHPIEGYFELSKSTFFHGNKNEVPGQFSHRMEGSSSTISSTVHIPLLPNLKIRGLNIFTVYTNSRNYSLAGALVTEINNKSKGLKWVYQPSCYGIPNDDEDMIWLSHWKLGNQLEAGDEVTVSVVMGARYNCFKVKAII